MKTAQSHIEDSNSALRRNPSLAKMLDSIKATSVKATGKGARCDVDIKGIASEAGVEMSAEDKKAAKAFTSWNKFTRELDLNPATLAVLRADEIETLNEYNKARTAKLKAEADKALAKK